MSNIQKKQILNEISKELEIDKQKQLQDARLELHTLRINEEIKSISDKLQFHKLKYEQTIKQMKQKIKELDLELHGYYKFIEQIKQQKEEDLKNGILIEENGVIKLNTANIEAILEELKFNERQILFLKEEKQHYYEECERVKKKFDDAKRVFETEMEESFDDWIIAMRQKDEKLRQRGIR